MNLYNYSDWNWDSLASFQLVWEKKSPHSLMILSFGSYLVSLRRRDSRQGPLLSPWHVVSAGDSGGVWSLPPGHHWGLSPVRGDSLPPQLHEGGAKEAILNITSISNSSIFGFIGARVPTSSRRLIIDPPSVLYVGRAWGELTSPTWINSFVRRTTR